MPVIPFTAFISICRFIPAIGSGFIILKQLTRVLSTSRYNIFSLSVQPCCYPLRALPLSADASLIAKEEIASDFAAPFHFHEGFEFTYIVKGHGKFYGGDRLLNFTEEDVYLFGIGLPHYFVNEKQAGKSVHSIILQFKEDFLGHDFYLKPEFKQVKDLLKTAGRGIKIIKPSVQVKKLLNEAVKLTGLKARIGLLQLLEAVSALGTDQIVLISSDSYKTVSKNHLDADKLQPVYRYALENFKNDVNTIHAQPCRL